MSNSTVSSGAYPTTIQYNEYNELSTVYVGQKIRHNGNIWVNISGVNSTPNSSSPDWKYVDKDSVSITPPASSKETFINNEDDLQDLSNSGKRCIINTNIALTKDIVMAPDITLVPSFGYIHLGANKLTGNNTSFEVIGSKIIIDSSQGNIDGTWMPPKSFYVTNLGAKGIGKEYKGVVSGNVSETIINISTNDLDASLIGKEIHIIGGNDMPLGGVLKGVITGINSNSSLTIDTPLKVSVSNANAVICVDDHNAINNASFIRNNQSGELIFPTKRTFFVRAIEKEQFVRNKPTGLIIGDNSDYIKWKGLGATLQTIPHDLPKTILINTYKTRHSEIERLKLRGDYHIHPSEGIGKTEHVHSIRESSLVTGTVIKDCDIKYFYADALIGEGDTQHTNYIHGANKVNATTDSTITTGYIDSNGNIDSSNTDYCFSTDLLPLDSVQFKQIEDFGDKPYYSLTGGGFSGWSGMTHPEFWAFYYDKNDVLLWKSHTLQIYDRIPIEEGVSKIRILIKTKDSSNLDLRIRPDLTATRLVFKNNTVSYCGRNGMSNIPSYSCVKNNTFKYIGGLSAGPGYGICIEDARRNAKFIDLEENTFYNNWGDVKLVGTENVNVTKNKFKDNTISVADKGAPTNEGFHVALGLSEGRNVICTENMIYGKAVTLDRQTKFSNNKMNRGVISYTANSSVISDNDFINVRLKSTNEVNKDREGHPSKFSNNNFYYSTRENAESWYSDPSNNGIFDNNTFHHNWIGNLSYDASIEDVSTFSNNDNRLFNDVISVKDNGGFWINNTIKGTLIDPSKKDWYHATGFMPLGNHSNNVIYHNITFKNGLQKNYSIDNMTFNGWIELAFNQFGNSLNNPPTFKISNSSVYIGDDYLWTNTGAYLLDTAAKNVNLEVANTSFILDKESAVTGSTNRFIRMKHLGTSLFVDSVFKSKTPKVIDFTNTLIFPETLGAITLINPVTENISFVLRDKDKMLFTKPNKNMPVYANNTEALTNGYDVGYLYATPDGSISILN